VSQFKDVTQVNGLRVRPGIFQSIFDVVVSPVTFAVVIMIVMLFKSSKVNMTISEKSLSLTCAPAESDRYWTAVEPSMDRIAESASVVSATFCFFAFPLFTPSFVNVGLVCRILGDRRPRTATPATGLPSGLDSLPFAAMIKPPSNTCITQAISPVVVF
jgi:hypothetical protein